LFKAYWLEKGYFSKNALKKAGLHRLIKGLRITIRKIGAFIPP
jgi:hypothetical protein